MGYILERQSPYYDSNKDVTKDGLHILFPYCVIEKEVHKFILNRLIQICKDTNIFDKFSNINKVNDIIDKASVTNNWLLYGSSKSITILPKLLKYILNSDLNNIINNKEIDEELLIKLFSIQNKINCLKIKNEYISEIYKENNIIKN